jgi:hypothetical protein
MPTPDPFANDPARSGYSMALHAPLLVACLDTATPQSLFEVGAFNGDLTCLLAEWAQAHGATVGAIDPMPMPGLLALAREHAAVELVREKSADALQDLSADAFIIDGDHNYWTVREELRLIAERAVADRRPMPLVLLHDVGWPCARRDDYCDIAQIPSDYRQEPLVGRLGIVPGDPGVCRDGLPYTRSAAHEGGERNGVLTAVEQFVVVHPRLRLAVVPGFCGFGVIWASDAGYANALAALLAPYDGHPLLAALEENRLYHFAQAYMRQMEIRRLKVRLARQESTLRGLLDSADGEIPREALRRALADPESGTHDPLGAALRPLARADR